MNEVLLESNGFQKEEDFFIYQENANSLIKVLDKTTQRDLLLMAELHRNLGDFESYLKALDHVTDLELLQLAYGIFKKCNAKNKEVFELK